MKKLIWTLCLLLSAASAFADIENAPFQPEVDKRFDALEQGNHIYSGSYPAGAVDGHYVKQYIKATYDFAVNTGATGTYDLKVGLPANSIITRTYLYSITKPTTSASGTLAWYCQNPNNILGVTAAASYPAAGSTVDGIQSGAAGGFSVITAACDIKAVIGTGALTAGKVVLYLDYVVHQ